MAFKGKSKNAAQLDNLTLSVNEKILRECHSLYTEDKIGLISIAADIDIHLLAPRKKITVLLIGNHSAGKSTFINWYIEEHVQRTGVAIETQGFTIVTSGRKRESLTGNATLHLYPHLEPLQNRPGVLDYVTTEITTSKQKKFNLVTFIDTPGLVDGDMKYPFDVNDSILWLGEHIADRIFVFFDPIGQALCKRTLNIVEHLSEHHAEIMKFYLSKADEAGHESDRQRVMMQIVQELCKRPNLNRTGFDMPTIYVPNMGKTSKCVNQIEEVCKEIEKTINTTIQNTLNKLEKDCTDISQKIDKLIEEDNAACSYNLRAKGKGFLYAFVGSILPLLLLGNLLSLALSKESLEAAIGRPGAEALTKYTAPVATLWTLIPPNYHYHAASVFILLTLILLFAAHLASRSMPTLSRKRKRSLIERKNYVQDHVKIQKAALYKEYLQQSVAAHDI
uniref:Dynamin N-terminal domain-containing protein n=1 Tax=Ciona savignyi TaxID=51511 RepID=H2ZHA9_CIOSA